MPRRTEAQPKSIPPARCRELLGEEAEALTEDEVMAVARHAEAMAHLIIELVLKSEAVH